MPNSNSHHNYNPELETFETESGGESDFPPIRIRRNAGSPEGPAHGAGMPYLQPNPGRRQDSGTREAQPPSYTQACHSSHLHQVPAASGSGIHPSSNNENRRLQPPAIQPQLHHVHYGNAPRAFGEAITNTLGQPQVSFITFQSVVYSIADPSELRRLTGMLMNAPSRGSGHLVQEAET